MRQKPPESRDSDKTPGERYIDKIMTRIFLSRWNRPRVYIDRKSGNTIGKELCDHLVIFEDNVLIISDKGCKINKEADLDKCAPRWHRDAVERSIDQIYGAERWIKTYPDRIFEDIECTQPLSALMPSHQEMKIHRIAVVDPIGILQGDTITDPMMILGFDNNQNGYSNENHFVIGNVGEKNQPVHVIEIISLGILSAFFTTAGEFIKYLNYRNQKIFVENKSYRFEIQILEDYFQWPNMIDELDSFKEEQTLNDETISPIGGSRIWDEFINHINKNSLPQENKMELEMILRQMAKLTRLERLELTHDYLHFLSVSTPEKITLKMCTTSLSADTCFLFVKPNPEKWTFPSREHRIRFYQDILSALSLKIQHMYPHLGHIVSFAFEDSTESVLTALLYSEYEKQKLPEKNGTGLSIPVKPIQTHGTIALNIGFTEHDHVGISNDTVFLPISIR